MQVAWQGENIINQENKAIVTITVNSNPVAKLQNLGFRLSTQLSRQIVFDKDWMSVFIYADCVKQPRGLQAIGSLLICSVLRQGLTSVTRKQFCFSV